MVDQFHNSPGSGDEAVYVNSLVVPSGTTLDLNGLHLYVRAAQIKGSIAGGSVSTLASGGPIALGDPTPGTIQLAGDVITWTVYGRANQGLSVVVNTGSLGVPTPLSPALNYAQVQLIDPNGNILNTASNSQSGADAVLLGVTLPVDGTYRILVSAAPAHPLSTGGYNLTVYDATTRTLPAALNQTINGQIYTPYSQDQWTFSALANQQVKFDLIASGNSELTFGLTGPNGYVGFSGLTTSSDLLTLPASGTYTLTVYGLPGAYAFDLVQTSLTNLTLGTAYQGDLAGSAQAQLFKVNVPTSGQLLVSLQDAHASDSNEIYLQYGSPPTRSSYQYRYANLAAANQQVLAPSAVAGDWYILVYGNSVPAPSSFTLTAQEASVFLFSINPAQHGNIEDTTLSLNGAGFTSGTIVSLVSADGQTTYPLSDPTVGASTEMTAIIPANSVPPGTYTVKVTQADGSSATLPNGFTMVQGGQAVLNTKIIVPNPIGYHIGSTLYVEYSNTGNIAMPAPLLVVTADQKGVQGGGS